MTIFTNSLPACGCSRLPVHPQAIDGSCSLSKPPPASDLPDRLNITATTEVYELPREVFGELVRLAEAVAAELFEGGPVAWRAVWVRLHGAVLADGRKLNLEGPESPVQQSVRRYIEQA